MPPKTTAPTAPKKELAAVFQELKQLLDANTENLAVAVNSDTYYLLNTRFIMKNKRPLCFGGVRLGKAYVSYYLMGIYACPEMLAAMSPELKRRMQGKSCFNFKEIDPALFSELKQLTKATATRFRDEKVIAAIKKAQGG